MIDTMNPTAEDKFTNYADMMLLNIADELNIKEVRLLLADEPVIEVVYHYDTISGNSNGFTVEVDKKFKEAPKTLLIALTKFLSGNIVQDMQKIRTIVSDGLKQRNEASIRVRQPLQSITIKI